MSRFTHYLATLSIGRLILWCYFMWYIVVVRYFDPNPRIWLTAGGVSLIIGFALMINATRSGSTRVKIERWPAIRFFLFPFCVSSFSALVKEHKFLLVFSPNWREMAVAAGLCAALWATSAALRRRYARAGSDRLTSIQSAA